MRWLEKNNFLDFYKCGDSILDLGDTLPLRPIITGQVDARLAALPKEIAAGVDPKSIALLAITDARDAARG